MTKIHHSAVDGMSGAEILAVLLDLQPDGRDVPPCRGDEAGARRRASSRCSPAASPACRASRCAWRATCRRRSPTSTRCRRCATSPARRSSPRRRASSAASLSPRRTDGGVLEGRRLRAPRTRFQAALSPHRRVGWGSVSLTDVKAVKNTFGCTVNDVVMTMCASAMRSFLLEHGELPDEPLVTMVPVSVRTPEQFGTFGNRISTMVVELPTDEADPRTRLDRMSSTMASRRSATRRCPRRSSRTPTT